MEKGTNYNVDYVLRYIGNKKDEVESYIAECLTQEFTDDSNPELIADLKLAALEFIDNLTSEEQKSLRSYTGYQFRNINAVLRGKWNYEVNGLLTPELKKEYYELADQIRLVLNKAVPIPKNFKTYRGVSLLAFNSYSIFDLEDLPYLKGKYLYEEGFTSTSIEREKSFFYTNPYTLTGKPNILIEYLIPEGSDDGILLIDDTISYSPSQKEFIINSSSLFKVLDVKVDKQNNVAYLQVILIPEKVWNLVDYTKEKVGISRK